jgi:hypothetical protein
MKKITLSNLIGKINEGDIIEKICQFFSINQRLITVSGEKCLLANNWPKGSGVYVVRYKQTTSLNGIIYIGKCGKIKQSGDKCVKNKSTFSDRILRWTPYCFQNSGKWENCFEFIPNFGSNKKLIGFDEMYQKRIPLKDIDIDCFLTNDIEDNISPTLLETIMLQYYFKEKAALPPANREL